MSTNAMEAPVKVSAFRELYGVSSGRMTAVLGAMGLANSRFVVASEVLRFMRGNVHCTVQEFRRIAVEKLADQAADRGELLPRNGHVGCAARGS